MADDGHMAPLVEVASTSDEHGTPSEDMECMATMEDITQEDGNYCEYRTMPSGRWHKSLYCSAVVQRMINTQFPEYISGVRKADCAADLKRRLDKGPPIWVSDKHALPIPEEDTHIERVWFAKEGKEYSAKLRGCVEVRETGTHTPRTRRGSACAQHGPQIPTPTRGLL
jgi:hypothetical protein